MSNGNDREKLGGKSTLSKRTAFLLDDFIRIPGTQKRIGLDPIIGLIPGFGDYVTAMAGLVLLFSGVKSGVPKSVSLRMLANWALNSLVGAIPFAGDLFSFWFKSNLRNQRLIQTHLEKNIDQRAETRSWWPFLILLTLVVSVFVAIGALIWLTARWIFS